MEKSHVGMADKICPVSGKQWTIGLLFDKGLKNTLERNTITGYDICPEVQEQLDKGFVALVAVDESKSSFMPNGNLNPEGAYRTGKIVYVKKEKAKEIFNIEIVNFPFVYIDEEVVKLLESSIDE